MYVSCWCSIILNDHTLYHTAVHEGPCARQSTCIACSAHVWSVDDDFHNQYEIMNQTK